MSIYFGLGNAVEGGSNFSGVVAVDRNGTELWTWESTAGGFDQIRQIVVTESELFVAQGAFVACVDKSDGSQKWIAESIADLGGQNPNAIALTETQVIVGIGGRQFGTISRSDGTGWSSNSFGTSGLNFAAPVSCIAASSDGDYYFGNGENNYTIQALLDATRVNEARTSGSAVGDANDIDLSFDGDFLYAFSKDRLTPTTTGIQRFTADLATRTNIVEGDPVAGCVKNGVAYWLDERASKIIATDLGDGSEIWSVAWDDSTATGGGNTRGIASNGQIVVCRNGANTNEIRNASDGVLIATYTNTRGLSAVGLDAAQPPTPEQQFNSSYADVSGRDPLPTALQQRTPAQNLVNYLVSLYAGTNPRIVTKPVQIELGELAKTSPAPASGDLSRQVWIEDDRDPNFKGGRWATILGRSGGRDPGTVELTLFIADNAESFVEPS